MVQILQMAVKKKGSQEVASEWAVVGIRNNLQFPRCWSRRRVSPRLHTIRCEKE
jgi:hypothetical protein